jgi:diguanylate cyclase (GGDEF)-like protein
MEIIRLTRDPDSSAKDLARVLGQDPVLSARLLQVANSPAYGLASEVTTIERATALLGTKAVKMMALSFSLASEVTDTGPLDLGKYWYHSLLSAVTARRWGELIVPLLTEEAFLAGLLGHFGRLILARDNPALYAPVVEMSADGWPDDQLEYECLGFTSGQLTARILEQWGLPGLICGAVGELHGISSHVGLRGRDELLAALKASRATEAVLSPGSRPDELGRLQEHAERVGLDADALDDMVIQLEQHMTNLAEVLDVDLPADLSPQKMLDEARINLVSVSLSAVADLQQVARAAEQLRTANEELGEIARTDGLTGIPNRYAFDDHLERTIAKLMRQGQGSLGLLMFDIDEFKAFNDAHGHVMGDEVLRQVAGRMRDVARVNELFARYGGEEFVLVVTDCSPEQVHTAGDRLRKAVEHLGIVTDVGELSVTVSAGAAYLSKVESPADGRRLIEEADAALYRAKAQGRNCVCGPDGIGSGETFEDRAERR